MLSLQSYRHRMPFWPGVDAPQTFQSPVSSASAREMGRDGHGHGSTDGHPPDVFLLRLAGAEVSRSLGERDAALQPHGFAGFPRWTCPRAVPPAGRDVRNRLER
jgi:hypothetical protein